MLVNFKSEQEKDFDLGALLQIKRCKQMGDALMFMRQLGIVPCSMVGIKKPLVLCFGEVWPCT